MCHALRQSEVTKIPRPRSDWDSSGCVLVWRASRRPGGIEREESICVGATSQNFLCAA